MADTTFVDFNTIILSSWLQDVNNSVYRGQVPVSASRGAVIAYNNTGQQIPNAAPTSLNNWITVQDQGNNFVPATGIFTASYTGFYQFNGSINFENNLPVNTEIILAFNVNGAETQEVISYVSQFNGPSLQISGLAHLTQGQGAYLTIYQNSGIAQPVWANNNYRNTFSIIAIG